MAQYEHMIERVSFLEGPHVCIFDGRATCYMPLDEFLSFASHIAAVAAGAEQSLSEQMQERLDQGININLSSKPFTETRSPALSSILSAIGIGEGSGIKRRKL